MLETRYIYFFIYNSFYVKDLTKKEKIIKYGMLFQVYYNLIYRITCFNNMDFI